MSKQLARAVADTPDDFCCNCGTGIFDMRPTEKANQLGHGSMLIHADLCRTCALLEEELIRQSGTENHPLRVAHYEKMLGR